MQENHNSLLYNVNVKPETKLWKLIEEKRKLRFLKTIHIIFLKISTIWVVGMARKNGGWGREVWGVGI